MTLSKIYKEQHPSPPPQSKPKKSPPLRGFALSPTNSSKNIHKRVLSSSSVNDYFASAEGRSSSASAKSPNQVPEIGVTKASPGPRLPKFERVENVGSNPPPQRPGLTKQNLSSSKIYERRMKQFQDEINNTDEKDILSEADLAEEELADDEVDTKYKAKLDEMKKKDGTSFYNTDESDVDINSDDGDSNSPRDTAKESKSNTVSPDQHNDHASSSSASNNEGGGDGDDDDEKKFHLKNLFRRKTLANVASNDDTSTMNSDGTKKRSFLKRMALGEDDEFDHIPDDNLFMKFVNMSGGGMVPGAAKTTNQKQDDEEAQLENKETDIPLQNLDPEQEAKDLLDAHRHHYSNSTASSSKTRVDNSDESTLRPDDSSFLAPNPDYYLRSEDGVFDANLDGGDESYIAPPERVRGGVLSSLLKLYQNPAEASRSKLQLAGSTDVSPVNSALTTPIKEHENPYDVKGFGKRLKNFATGNKKKVTIDDQNLEEQQNMLHGQQQSTTDLTSSSDLLSPEHAKKAGSSSYLPSFNKTSRPQGVPAGMGPGLKPKLIKGASGMINKKREQARAKITVHIADLLQRQRFILRMAKTLMLYGAPTHRLEDYLRMTARVLEIDAQFIYLPGCMIVSFGDITTRTSEVQIVRCSQGLDLYKLHRVHRIYKQVIHDLVGVDEASTLLDDLLASKPTFSPWMCVLIYGLSSAFVTPWAFGGGWINLPVSFGIGCLVGFLQFILSPKSNLYSNVFEVGASIVVSFIARALASISGSDICYASVTQGCLALILPGWFILSGSLELQSRNLVSGSVRMFYAVIYSLFLGYGITLGAALYGWIDKSATSSTTCSDGISDWWRFLFVPLFTCGLATINQARLFQLPVMLFISCAGHVVSYFSGKHFYNSTQFTAAIASFVIGVLGNLYSRIFKGIAVSAMLPAVFVQIPGGMAAKDALLSGIQAANQITSNSSTSTTEQALSGMAVGINLIQVCIGITVGLFVSTIVVYPFGKRSTSVFTL
ncbi:Pheromone-regulated membrane protein 10 [Cyberlindnera fabianii]|uniref:Pheromone-regulated membrane protein 10 n=1 Tax=Cyberlindnera fabianii TaxID=36022 RepID=A0A1V2L6S6_CYBFA|nr:Pheromone-regulated membrane protein 10 [Cyberlindnera fabianii]